MFGTLEITKFSIVIVARNNNPSILNPDFLKINKIIADDWETTSPIFTTEQLSQVVYKNQISIQVQPDKLIFNEAINNNNFQGLIPNIARKYLEVLPHVNYSALGINIISHVIAENSDEIDNYFGEYILRSGDWKKYQNVSPNPSFSLNYPLENCQINISISPAKIESQEADYQHKSVILFTGNIHRDFSDLKDLEKQREKLKQYLGSWENDLKDYQNIINQCLLNQG